MILDVDYMNISSTLYNKILTYDYPSCECGIVLGGKNNQITELYFDCKSKGENYYIPNVRVINQIIEKWSDENIDFLGIAHTHPCFQLKLSSVDIEYIKEILFAMPTEIEQLYFPIVLPKKDITFYRCFIDSNQLQVIEDEIKITKGE